MANKVTIIGAGLVGSLLAVYLRKRNYDVVIYERRPDMRRNTGPAGRSINLALSDRGIKALKEVGLYDKIKPIAIPMHGRKMHAPDGTETYQPYGKEGQYINSVSRAHLNIALMNEAEAAGAVIHFDHRCHAVDWKNKTVDFERDGTCNKVSFDVLFGADGSYSAARLNHQLAHDRFQYHQFYIDYGYKELHIPAGENGEFRLEKNALHIWPRGKYMMIALPNPDGSFTCTLFFPFEGEESFAALNSDEQINAFMQRQFADALAMMPDLLQTWHQNPVSSLVTVKCFPWIRGDFFALIGDAAHAIVPFFGQGMNAGFEDCSVLNDLLGKHGDDLQKVFTEFEALRKPDADAIADLALANFLEMRDKVADPKFLLQKKIEAKYSSLHPDQWTPAYSMVTFSPHIRYSEALAKGLRQQRIMDDVMEMANINADWESDAIMDAISKKLREQNVQD